MRNDVRIVVTWDAETGCIVDDKLLDRLLAVPGDYMAVIKPYDDDTTTLIYADDWISEAEAQAAVKEILKPPFTN